MKVSFCRHRLAVTAQLIISSHPSLLSFLFKTSFQGDAVVFLFVCCFKQCIASKKKSMSYFSYKCIEVSLIYVLFSFAHLWCKCFASCWLLFFFTLHYTSSRTL